MNETATSIKYYLRDRLSILSDISAESIEAPQYRSDRILMSIITSIFTCRVSLQPLWSSYWNRFVASTGRDEGTLGDCGRLITSGIAAQSAAGIPGINTGQMMPWMYLFIYLFIHSFIYSFINLSIYSLIYPYTYLFIYLFIYLSINLCIYSFIHLFIHTRSVTLDNYVQRQYGVRSLPRALTNDYLWESNPRPFIPLLFILWTRIHSFIHLFIHSSIYFYIYSFIHLLILWTRSHATFMQRQYGVYDWLYDWWTGELTLWTKHLYYK